MTGNYTVKSVVAAGTYKVTDTIAVLTDVEAETPILWPPHAKS